MKTTDQLIAEFEAYVNEEIADAEKEKEELDEHIDIDELIRIEFDIDRLKRCLEVLKDIAKPEAV